MTRTRRAFWLLCAAGFWVSGCPILAEDDFEIVSAIDASAGSSGASGSGGSAGTPGDGAVDGDADAALDCSMCSANECCDERCVNLMNDRQNCGMCGQACPGTACVGGGCTNTCAFGFLDCDMNVGTGCEVDALNDIDNCGSCGTQCAFDSNCLNGMCMCPEGAANCNGTADDGCEVSLLDDALNCGACGTSCGVNQACMQGQCTCAPGFDNCDGTMDNGCEEDLTDPRTCGSCSNDCGANSTCTGTTCGCSAGFLKCGGSTTCDTPVTDPANCGGCGTMCGGGTPICNGTSCVNGCTASETQCGNSCVDTKTNLSNCGGCGLAVGANQTCVNGNRVCLPDFANCDGNQNNGCEVDTRSDPLHCGSCPNACKAGAICAGSACQCAASTPNDCGADCRACCNSGQCSDGDACTQDTCTTAGVCSFGAACAGGGKCCSMQSGCFQCCGDGDCNGGQVCSGNVCVTPSCTGGDVLCNGVCVNLTSNAMNCGGCGNACGPGRSCAGSNCTPKWVSLGSASGSAPSARSRSAYTWTGSRVFVWGGESSSNTALANGGRYDPAADAWVGVSNTGAPSARVLATAVWTGSVVVVWGGSNVAGTSFYNDGGRYDPVANSWQGMTTSGAPSGRAAAYGVWTGSRVLFWGGSNASGAVGRGYLYDPVNDAWSDASPAGDPGSLEAPAFGWSSTALYVYGGRPGGNGQTDATSRYSMDSWQMLGAGPAERYSAFGGWDGSGFVAWGGYRQGGGAPVTYDDGKRYDPTAANWTSMNTVGAPSARLAVPRDSGWTARVASQRLLVLGGKSGATYLKNGAIFNAGSNDWSAVGAWPSGEDHSFGAAVWTGSEFVLWGGEHMKLATATGERFRP